MEEPSCIERTGGFLKAVDVRLLYASKFVFGFHGINLTAAIPEPNKHVRLVRLFKLLGKLWARVSPIAKQTF